MADLFANAVELTGASGSLTGQSNIGAGVEAGEPAPTSGSGDATIWYKITAPETSSITVKTAGSQFAGDVYDTVLSVWVGSTVSALSPVTDNDDTDVAPFDLTSNVSWVAVAGTTYYVRVAAYSSTEESDEIAVSWATSEIAAPDPGLYAVIRSSVASHANQRGIWKIDEGDGTLTQLVDFASEGVGSTAQFKPMFRPTDGTVWTTGFNVELYWWDAAGGNLIETYVLSGGSLGGGAWLGDVLYLSDQGANGRLVSFDPSTGAFTTLVDNLYDGSPNFYPGEDLTIAGSRIYVSKRQTSHAIWSCALDGTDVRLEHSDVTTSGSLGVIVVDSAIYGANRQADRLERWPINLDGTLGTRTIPWTMVATTDDPTSVATDGTDLYIGSNNGQVFKLQTVATPTTQTTLLDTENGAGDFADIEYVAWFEGVAEVAIDNGPWIGFIGA